MQGEPIPQESFILVNAIPSRDYTTGLLVPKRADEAQQYETNCPHPGKWLVVGAVSAPQNGRIAVRVKNKFTCDDNLALFTPQGLISLDAHSMQTLDGKDCALAPGDGHHVSLKCDANFDPSLTFLIKIAPDMSAPLPDINARTVTN